MVSRHLGPEPRSVSAGGQLTSVHGPLYPNIGALSGPPCTPPTALRGLALRQADALQSGLRKAGIRMGLAAPGERAEGTPKRGRKVLNGDSVEGSSRGPVVGKTCSLDLWPGRVSGNPPSPHSI